jgi:hypothetical protein
VQIEYGNRSIVTKSNQFSVTVKETYEIESTWSVHRAWSYEFDFARISDVEYCELRDVLLLHIKIGKARTIRIKEKGVSRHLDLFRKILWLNDDRLIRP